MVTAAAARSGVLLIRFAVSVSTTVGKDGPFARRVRVAPAVATSALIAKLIVRVKVAVRRVNVVRKRSRYGIVGDGAKDSAYSEVAAAASAPCAVTRVAVAFVAFVALDTLATNGGGSSGGGSGGGGMVTLTIGR